MPGMVVHAFNPSAWETEAGGSEFDTSLQSEFQDSQGYRRETLSQKNKPRKSERERWVWQSNFHLCAQAGIYPMAS